MNFRQVTENILGRPPAPNEGMADEALLQNEARLGIKLPAGLRTFYTYLGNLDLFMSGYHRFTKPKDWQVYDDKLVFLAEHQAVVYWAVNLNNGTTVYQTQTLAGEADWYKEDLELEPFLEAMLYLQCVMADETIHAQIQGGYEFFASLDATHYQQNVATRHYLNQLEQQCTQVVQSNGLAIFWQPNTILLYFVNAQGTPEEVLLACTKNEALFDELIDKCGFAQL